MADQTPGVRRSTIIRPKPGLAYQELVEGSGGVFLHLETGQYHGVNEVGALVWSLVGDGTRFGDLVDAVREQVDDPPPDLSEDIAAFLTDLEARDLISLEDGAGDDQPR
jgi:hypothetical protein